MFFWKSLAFLMIQRIILMAIWSLVPLPFLNPAWTSGSSWFTYCWSLAWRILTITLLAYAAAAKSLQSCPTLCYSIDGSAIVRQFDHSLALPFFGIGMKTDVFLSCAHCWVFQICWPIQCRTFTASGFRIWIPKCLEFHHLYYLCFQWCFLRPIWLHIQGCLALGEWSHHRDYLGCKIFLVQFFYVFLPPLLNIFCFC